jgi:hypothetical protein
LTLSLRTLLLKAPAAIFSRHFAMLLALTTCFASAQRVPSIPQPSSLPPGTPNSWIEAAAGNELAIINDDGRKPLRFRIRKVDSHSDTTRIQIESQQGDVARLIERNGHELTPTENQNEVERLQAILASPQDFLRHHKHDDSTRTDVDQLVSLMPKAMLFSYVPGQPQLPNVAARQIVIDFRPDPSFRPPTMLSDALTGIEGRVWIDAATRHMTRIEGRFLKTVNFGYGIIARIYPGGSIEFDQTNVGDGRWAYSHLVEHLTVRAMMIKTIPEDTQMTATDFHLLPGPIDFQQAVRELLALPVPAQ